MQSFILWSWTLLVFCVYQTELVAQKHNQQHSKKYRQNTAQKLNLLYERYNAAVSRQHYSEAALRLDEILGLDPRDNEARKQRCLLDWEQGNWKQLRCDYDALVAYSSDPALSYKQRGLLLWYEGLCEKACADVQRAFAVDSSSVSAQLIRAVCDTQAEERMTMSLLEQEVLQEINALRVSPAAYIPIVQEEFFTSADMLASKEGKIVLAEVLETLALTPPLPVLQFAVPLIVAAKDHADDLGKYGIFGHYGSDSSTPAERVGRYALHRKGTGENIGYGVQRARTLVVGLLLDDGIVGRGHRLNILNPRYRSCGVGIAHHKQYPCVCVQVFEEAVYPVQANIRKK